MAVLIFRAGREPVHCKSCGGLVAYLSGAKLRMAASFTPMRNNSNTELLRYVTETAAVTCATCEDSQATAERRVVGNGS
jgi:ribosomal protein S27E